VDEAFFGEWLKKQRSSRGLTQKQLARQIGCATITLRKIESGERNPSVQIVKRIAEIFQIPSKEEKDFLRFSRGGWRSVPAEMEEDVSWRSSSQFHEDEVPARSGIHLATFFFTDIEGSVRLWESAPDKMKVALQRHHAIMQEAITSNGGEVFQTVGDGFCAVFATGSNAISAAVTAQRKLYQASWDLPFPMRVRIGIHTGEAEPLEHGSSTGGYASNSTMNRVAHILNAAHGGQVLLSSVTKELLKDRLPANTEFLDLGKHYLKDLARPEHLLQLDITGLPSFFPPLKTLNTRHNLPVQLTSFVGREKEITDVIDLLGRSRLITLTGPGGTGKTRLSLQVGSELVYRYLDGIWIVELASILDPMLIPRTAANALGLREEPQRPVLDMLCDYLRDKHLLLILDNCEHLVEACAEFAHRLLQAGSQIRYSKQCQGLAITRIANWLGNAEHSPRQAGRLEISSALATMKLRKSEHVGKFEGAWCLPLTELA
jgi:class 3 adenylate cyclase